MPWNYFPLPLYIFYFVFIETLLQNNLKNSFKINVEKYKICTI